MNFLKKFALLNLINFFCFFGYKNSYSYTNVLIRTKINEVNNYGAKVSNTFNNYELSKICEKEINFSLNTTLYKTKEYRIVRDFDDNNYLFVTFYPFGSSVMHIDTLETIEVNPFSEFDDLQYYNYYYPVIGLLKKINNFYYSVNKNNFLSENTTDLLKSKSKSLRTTLQSNYNNSIQKKIKLYTDCLSLTNSSNNNDVQISNGIVKAHVEVPYSWFFKYNTTRFSYSNGGSNGICEYVAFLLMIEYNDFFKAKGYFSDEEISKYVVMANSSSYQYAIPVVKDEFVLDLFELNNNKESLTANDLDDLANLFMKDKKVTYILDHAYGPFGSPIDVIRKGFPDMLCGVFSDLNGGLIPHNIVAYGAFVAGPYRDYYLTHYGWDNHSQVITIKNVLTGYDWSIQDTTTNPEERLIFMINGRPMSGKNYKG